MSEPAVRMHRRGVAAELGRARSLVEGDVHPRCRPRVRAPESCRWPWHTSPAGAAILDLGTGEGQLARRLFAAGWRHQRSSSVSTPPPASSTTPRQKAEDRRGCKQQARGCRSRTARSTPSSAASSSSTPTDRGRGAGGGDKGARRRRAIPLAHQSPDRAGPGQRPRRRRHPGRAVLEDRPLSARDAQCRASRQRGHGRLRPPALSRYINPFADLGLLLVPRWTSRSRLSSSSAARSTWSSSGRCRACAS